MLTWWEKTNFQAGPSKKKVNYRRQILPLHFPSLLFVNIPTITTQSQLCFKGIIYSLEMTKEFEKYKVHVLYKVPCEILGW